jgi:hypothetical protein
MGYYKERWHGSLRWFPVWDNGLSQCKQPLMELKPEDREKLPANIKAGSHPELLLGPGSKVHVDDPFFTLLYQFRKSLLKAKQCVVIGFSYGDHHIRGIIDEAIDAGVFVLDVNFQGPNSRYTDSDYYRSLRPPTSAKIALRK